MTNPTMSAFNLPGRLAAKADPVLIADDEQHFAAIAASLEESVADLAGRLETELRAPGGIGQKALDRDQEIYRLTGRLRVLRRFGLDLCLGHMVSADDGEPTYVGRLGLTDREGRRLLLDCVAQAFEPGLRYPEAVVDDVLRVLCDDHAVLRRYLVDEGFLSRQAGVYWRSGGTVDLDSA